MMSVNGALTNSRARLDALRATGDAELSQFRLDLDLKEAERRKKEIKAANERQAKRTEELERSLMKMAAAKLRGQALHDSKEPQSLRDQMEQLRASLSDISSSKDTLIKELKETLRDKDETFVMSLRSHAKAVDRLVAMMNAQATAQSAAHTEELKAIQSVFEGQRAELIQSNTEELDELVEQRRNLEKQFMTAREKQSEVEHDRLEAQRAAAADDHVKLKRRLQFESHGLEQMLGRMRSVYQLNSEKLEYNLRVLTERVRENERAIQLHKRRLAKLQDVFSSVIARYHEAQRKYHLENQTLASSFMRLTRKHAETQARFRHSVKADVSNYARVWELNLSQARQLVAQCIAADKVVFDVLNVKWAPPPTDVFEDAKPFCATPGGLLGSRAEGEGVEESGGGKVGGGGSVTKGRGVAAEAKSGRKGSDGGSVAAEEGGFLTADMLEDASESLSGAARGMLRLLLEHCGFLAPEAVAAVTASLQQSAASKASGEEGGEDGGASAAGDGGMQLVTTGPSDPLATTVQRQALASILSSLGIRQTSEIVAAARGFFMGTRTTTNGDGVEGDQGDDVSDGGANTMALDDVCIAGEDVVGALQAYVRHRAQATAMVKSVNVASNAARDAARDAEKEIWLRIKDIISDERLRVWVGAERGLQRYNARLGERMSLVSDVDALRSQNQELRTSLEAKLSSQSAMALQSPPQLAALRPA